MTADQLAAEPATHKARMAVREYIEQTGYAPGCMAVRVMNCIDWCHDPRCPECFGVDALEVVVPCIDGCDGRREHYDRQAGILSCACGAQQ